MATVSSSSFSVRVVPPAGDTALEQFAATLASGQWGQLSPTPSGLDIFLGGPHSGLKTGYCTKMAYDPVVKKIWTYGGDHNDPQTLHHFEYDEATNAWTDLGTPQWATAPNFHGWEHFDKGPGYLWHRPYGARHLQRWDAGTSYTQVASNYAALFDYASPIAALCWFPELSRLIVAQPNNDPNGRVGGFPEGGGDGTIYASAVDGLQGTSMWCHYSRPKQLVWIGCGDASWILDATGTLSTARATAPYDIGDTNNQALPVVNPVSGTFFAMRNETTWHEYDPVANTWTARGGTCEVLADPVSYSDWPTFGVNAVGYYEYGVIVFIKAYSSGSPAQMWLFKP